MSAPPFTPGAPQLWQHYEGTDGSLWLGGALHGTAPEQLLRDLSQVTDDKALAALLSALDGHFALVAHFPDRSIAAVDRVRSIPLTYGRDANGAWQIDQTGGRLAKTLELSAINPDGALALAMAGYTIGRDTLFTGLESLIAGEAVIFDPSPRRVHYDLYDAWNVENYTTEHFSRTLAELTLHVLEKLILRTNGRPIAIPLSAGLDSRLIVSGLRHLGYPEVRCFSYGLPGNYEARAAKAIAERLGYPWRFVPYTPTLMRRFFASDDHMAYLAYADSATSSPFEQDLFAVRTLQEEGYISADTMMVNGNSGDFISGAHVLKSLHTPRSDLDESARRALISQTLIGKHFRLWDALATPANDARLSTRLERELDDLAPSFDPMGLHGVYEAMEFRDRQSKYVITGQRVYEHAGLSWGLPLWDPAYLDFWQRVPLSEKVTQRLYRTTLIQQNWGGVWGTEWWWKHTVSPHWLRLPRLILKALHAPLGRERWHRFEKRHLMYWMEVTCGQSMVPYALVRRDRRGARHSVAWQAEAYLKSKGLTLEEVSS